MQTVAGLIIKAAFVENAPLVTVGGEVFEPLAARQVANVAAQLGQHDLADTIRRATAAAETYAA